MNELAFKYQAQLLFLPREDQEKLLRKMVKKIENILKLAHVNQKHELHEKVEMSWKGYLSYSDIFQTEEFKQFLQELGFRSICQNQYFQVSRLLWTSIKTMSKQLWSNPGGVRLLSSCEADNLHQVCFQNFNAKFDCQCFQSQLAKFCTIWTVEYSVEDECAIVYTNQPQKIQNFRYSWFDEENQRFYETKVLSEECLQRQKERFREIASYLEHKQKYRAKIGENLPCVFTSSNLKQKKGKFIQSESSEELVYFGQSGKQYQSCILRQDGTFFVVFPYSNSYKGQEDFLSEQEQQIAE